MGIMVDGKLAVKQGDKDDLHIYIYIVNSRLDLTMEELTRAFLNAEEKRCIFKSYEF